ncbi:B-cell lymphoma 3 protein homolog isoform X1 [Montipora capricornis]|uniref:B-cell lymphoma 3 protein homolog isoform X1 n=1 Tax=Montipora capricornis TaxID=246305 RepID=UPI0035F1C8C3
MACGAEDLERHQRLSSTEEKGEGLTPEKEDSATALDENNSCVTQQAKVADHPTESPPKATSDNFCAIERDELNESATREATCFGSSPSQSSSVSSTETQSYSSRSGQGGQCVRTVAETLPMPDLFAQDEDGDTFLHIAIVQEDQPLTDFFIQRMKARGVDIYNKLRQTPLHLAVITHQIHMVRKLIESGADVNLMDRHGQTALHLACQDNDVNCVYAMRDVTRINSVAEIQLELKNSKGLSALHVATLNGNKQLIATILDMGADIDEEDSNSGRTPLHHAVEADNYSVTEYLISRGADVNKVTFAGNTPLHTASGRDMENMVKLLLAHGANVNIPNLEGDIPKVVRTSEQVKRQFQSKEKDSKRRKR